MPKLWSVSATQVKRSWGQVVRRILESREPALVERRGAATVVILPAGDYRQLVAREESQLKKEEALSLLVEAEGFARAVQSRYGGKICTDSVEFLREMREDGDEGLLNLR